MHSNFLTNIIIVAIAFEQLVPTVCDEALVGVLVGAMIAISSMSRRAARQHQPMDQSQPNTSPLQNPSVIKALNNPNARSIYSYLLYLKNLDHSASRQQVRDALKQRSPDQLKRLSKKIMQNKKWKQWLDAHKIRQTLQNQKDTKTSTKANNPVLVSLLGGLGGGLGGLGGLGGGLGGLGGLGGGGGLGGLGGLGGGGGLGGLGGLGGGAGLGGVGGLGGLGGLGGGLGGLGGGGGLGALGGLGGGLGGLGGGTGSLGGGLGGLLGGGGGGRRGRTSSADLAQTLILLQGSNLSARDKLKIVASGGNPLIMQTLIMQQKQAELDYYDYDYDYDYDYEEYKQ